MKTISVQDMLKEIREAHGQRAWIDVRSELEFARGSMPGSQLLPLLWQHERHEVGIAYKQLGQAAAYRRGEELVGPYQAERIAVWRQAIEASPRRAGIIMCWRGGLRSRIVSEWLYQLGLDVVQLEGGYKALRQALRPSIESPTELWILTGLTGSGKTSLLHSLPMGWVDLEHAAQHRGSSFGLWKGLEQPSQTTFENDLALQIVRRHMPPVPLLVEDESRMIGRLSIPEPFFQAMQKAPGIELDIPLDQRAARLYQEYLGVPLAAGVKYETLREFALEGLKSLERRLDARYAPLRRQMEAAFQLDPDIEVHQAWIRELLLHYYDKRYRHAQSRIGRAILFRGPTDACREWMIEQLQKRRQDA